MTNFHISYGTEVADALRDGRPVVALESTIVSHGLPRPDNLLVARQIEQAVRDAGAVPATIGMVAGELIVGLDDAQLTRLATVDGVSKLSVRDLAVAAATGADGATTVAATSAVAAAAGIGVFATGGLGGVHREAAQTFDESADLVTLARTPIAVVCAGVKSILDVGATLERLETLGVSVVGYRTRRFPGFYLTDAGFDLDWSVESPEQVADVLLAREAQGVHHGGLIVANPLPADEQLDPALHDRTLADGLALLARDGVTGKAVTPFLLAHFHSATEGASLAVNVRIILRNADLAARIAVAAATRRTAA
ncbi:MULTISPECIES: pseudouridine-5'-phosphate glycosidase [Micromonospora]|uniref:Pseudouridine-5'-phosphate glycosidase n=1 Tax=Micromonospora solifontis TaxID=2487138 RepID=A0ABX9WM43_9ACTN|nr:MULTISPECIES: pseudouridine-5'-phosphate glycosidase [Micromonospora]NES12888.1 pseudouridine-5'-phosphate glycosidase [Micromonospora sp. PPF5-17B]NES34794.1 pseudouridine-5'-phosphate glycosidase [Micromonospora solifontis]NES54813.1 pseudouridine-5'-phosphate glycosidase [Micromonospora sp. PPF5-6]RNM01693.1 pseudouridine-5'-phosphate glycosidase [Micromonospora solifontis]